MAGLIHLMQENFPVGDPAGNAQKILQAAADCRSGVLVTPELAICGYPPEDLLLNKSFVLACNKAKEQVVQASAQWPDLTIVFGYPAQSGLALYNSVCVARAGQVLGTYDKHQLPNYGVFDERRYFSAGHNPLIFEQEGTRFGVCVCEDVWSAQAPLLAKEAGAQILLVLNASPFEKGKFAQRLEAVKRNVVDLGMSAVYVNMAAAQDELVFDGRSFALGRSGLISELPAFEPSMGTVAFSAGQLIGQCCQMSAEDEGTLYTALLTGLKSYYSANGFRGMVLGLSGGIDSALVLKLAVDAAGPKNVTALMMPSVYTAQMSLDDAAQLASRLGVRYEVIPIEPAFNAYLKMLEPIFKGLPADVTEENIQARIRGTLVMAYSNKMGALALATGNKSEMAVGYSTLYGDLAGGYAPIKDIYKTEVYQLARWINKDGEVIPENIINRAPSAELRPDQTDQDSLPPYPELDAALSGLVERHLAPSECSGSPEVARRAARMLHGSEFKRRQAPAGTKVSSCAFGKDWRQPLTNRWKD